MCGAYTDNQPDFSWLQPGEEKRFTQVFMPYKQIGAPKNASKEAMLNLEIGDDQRARIGVYVSSPRAVRVVLSRADSVLFEKTLPLDPRTVFDETVALPDGVSAGDLKLAVYDGEVELLSYTPLVEQEHHIPAPATAARPPAEIASNEELFLNGLHLEQYRHATYEPEPYYEEALRRDPLDSRCNNALGLLLLRRGKFAEAEAYFRKAVDTADAAQPEPLRRRTVLQPRLGAEVSGALPTTPSTLFTKRSGIRRGRTAAISNWRGSPAAATSGTTRST